MVSTLPISFLCTKLRRIIVFFAEHVFPNLVFILAFISTCKAILEIILQIFLVKWSERFSMAKIILISYACYTIAAVGFSYSTTILSLFFTLLFLVIGESIALNHLLRFVSEIAPHDKRGLYFQFTVYTGIYLERVDQLLVQLY